MKELEKINRKEFLIKTGGLLSLSLLPWGDYQKLSAETENKVRQISSKEQLEKIISLNENTAIVFSATHCAYCLMYEPIFEETSREYPDIVFGKITLDKIPKKENDIFLKVYKVEFLPTTIFYHKNKEIFNKIGYMDKKNLTEYIKTYFK